MTDDTPTTDQNPVCADLRLSCSSGGATVSLLTGQSRESTNPPIFQSTNSLSINSPRNKSLRIAQRDPPRHALWDDVERMLRPSQLIDRFAGRVGGKGLMAQGGGLFGSAQDILAAAREAISQQSLVATVKNIYAVSDKVRLRDSSMPCILFGPSRSKASLDTHRIKLQVSSAPTEFLITDPIR